MFELTIAGKERGDCSAPFSVTLDKEYTVESFVKTVLTRTREYGYIGIKYNGDDGEKRWFGYPHCEYRCGKLLSSLPDELLPQKIETVKADGGYTRMDYVITLKQ